LNNGRTEYLARRWLNTRTGKISYATRLFCFFELFD
jgi:hypothetical protein